MMFNILKSLGSSKNCVFTFHNSGAITKSDIVDDASWEVELISGAEKLRKIPVLGSFKAFQFIISFLSALPRLRTVAHKNPTEPIMVCVGASARPVLYAYFLSLFLKNELWLYIVDDFHKINKLNGNKLEQLISNLFFKRVLRSTKRLIVISNGLREKYFQEFGIDSQVLLPCFDKVQLQNNRMMPGNRAFTFVFSGGLSMLYNDTLKQFAIQLSELKSRNELNSRLIIQTYSAFEDFARLDFPANVVEYRTSAERSSNIPSFREADCFIVPYSFDKVYADLVSTSFPQKVAELIQLRRPILFVGPKYSSVIDFFHKRNTSFIVNEDNLHNLSNIILEIAQNSRNEEILRDYATIYEEYFSARNVRAVLAN